MFCRGSELQFTRYSGLEYQKSANPAERQKVNKILISKSQHNNQYHVLREQNKNFQIHIYKLL